MSQSHPSVEVQCISASLMRAGQNQPTSHDHASQPNVRLVSRMTLYAPLPTDFCLRHDAAEPPTSAYAGLEQTSASTCHRCGDFLEKLELF
ncbi:hypothetical protein N7486_008387 [Penicillium sp. IBT 16267x]|nr:hypothetical protein N7486_008387 [Penicillium sp. IBT 16267x]